MEKAVFRKVNLRVVWVDGLVEGEPGGREAWRGETLSVIQIIMDREETSQQPAPEKGMPARDTTKQEQRALLMQTGRIKISWKSGDGNNRNQK